MMLHLFCQHLLLTSQIPVFLRCQFLTFFSFLYYNFSLGNTIFFLILIKTKISMIFKPLSSAQTFKPQNCLLWATKNPHPNALQTNLIQYDHDFPPNLLVFHMSSSLGGFTIHSVSFRHLPSHTKWRS